MSHIHIQAALTPDRTAVVMANSGLSLTFLELEDRSNQAAQAFRALGLQRGDHVAFLLENRLDFFELLFAAQRAGLYFTFVSRYLGPEEASYIIRDCDARIFVASPGTVETASALRADLGPDVACFMLETEIEGFRQWEPFRASFPSERIGDEAKGAPMLYSSGTTGRPKGIKRPMENAPIEGAHPMMEVVCLKLANMTTDSTYLAPAPLYHSAPLAVAATALMYGAKVVVMEKFEPKAFLSAIEEFGVTHTQVVPTMFVRILKLPEENRSRYDLSSLRSAIHVAAPCPVEIKQRIINWWGPIVLEYYGGTEGNGVTICTSEEWLTRPGTVGRSMLGRIWITDEAGEPLPPNAIGDVFFDSGLAFEYHNDPEKTAKAHHPQGWSTLGDVGYLDEDGYLFLTDRRAYTIISGGVNVYPQETEDRLIIHPAVADAAVFGVPDGDLGEAVKAVVQLMDPDVATPELEAELIRWCRAAMSTIKCPKSIDFRTDMPRTETGKLMKRTLKETYWP
ncbi:acyl-CoA synthetase [Sedimentitalea todarodis]|uniref:Acyl-CoA synthetase n=1 Tax=Sedimentitalea todarodis TaxID=1631240 RepID=A0ABU3VE33_9RHOB|nr:acyl-CoA synthetase [Sedimentitalea todarodis]MDU9004440.1 acyl-CoA synthetase [Sedimentitalea todarodis]